MHAFPEWWKTIKYQGFEQEGQGRIILHLPDPYGLQAKAVKQEVEEFWRHFSIYLKFGATFLGTYSKTALVVTGTININLLLTHSNAAEHELCLRRYGVFEQGCMADVDICVIADYLCRGRLPNPYPRQLANVSPVFIVLRRIKRVLSHFWPEK